MGNVHFQARLNPNNEEEANAIDVLYVLEDKGFNRREILTAALLALADRDLSGFEPPENQAVKNAVSRAMDGMLDRFIDAVASRLDRLQAMPPDARREEMRNVARSSIGRSVINSVDVEEWSGDE